MGRGTVIICALVALLTWAAPAHAASVTGTASDPADAALGGHDITAATVAYDDAGTATATVVLREPPSAAADGFLAFELGTSGAGGCDTRLLVATFLDPAETEGAWIAEAGAEAATKAVDGAQVTLTATAPALAAMPLDCATVAVSRRGDNSVVLDGLAAPFGLTAAPAAPTPAPPAPGPAPTGSTPEAPAARLVLAVRAPKTMKRGRWSAATVRVTNAGTAPAKGVKLKVGAPKGIRASRTAAKLGTLAPGRSKAAKLRVRPRRTGTLALTATAQGTVPKARAALKVRFRKPRPRGGGGGGGTTPERTAPLALRYYTHISPDVMGPTNWQAFAFLDDRWAYRGIPEGRLPECTQKTAGVDEDGDPTDGCLPYEFDAKSGKLTIDGRPATLSDDKTALTIGEKEYAYAPLIRAGSRFEGELKSISTYGYWPNQSVTQRWLTLFPDGKFALTRTSMGSWGTPGTPGSGNWGAAPPDERGTYEFLPRGELRLTYENGEVDARMTAILPDHETGSADPMVDGLLFGGDQYWKE